jgi:hypothetical protein
VADLERSGQDDAGTSVMDIWAWIEDRAGSMVWAYGEALGTTTTGLWEESDSTMEMSAWLMERAEVMARIRGHVLGAMNPGAQLGVYIASCSRCGALAIVSVRAEHAGIRGTACSRNCRTRQAIRPLHPTAATAGLGS